MPFSTSHTMKLRGKLIAILVVTWFIMVMGFVIGQHPMEAKAQTPVSGQTLWQLNGTVIKPGQSNWTLRMTSMAGVGNRCVRVDADGDFSAAAADCGSGGGGTAWGAITGTLSAQTDLQAALDAKLSLAAWYATTTTALAEGTNLYYTSARATSSFSQLLAATTTTALAEGTNLYYTNARALAVVNGTSSWMFYNGSGVKLTTTTNQVLIGAAATTTRAKLEVNGDVYFSGNATSANMTATGTASSSNLFVSGKAAGLLALNAVGLGYTTATSAITGTGIISMSNAIAGVGGSASAISVTGGTNGQILAWLSGVPTWTASTSVAAGNGISVSVAGSVTTVTNTGVLTTRQLTVAGTANQITSSAGAQDLSADRTWTLSFPSAITFPGSITGPSATIGSSTLGTVFATGTVRFPNLNPSNLLALNGNSEVVATSSITTGSVTMGFFTSTSTASSSVTRLTISEFASTTQLSVSRGFFQDGMADCSGSTYLQYAIATGKFGCGTPAGGSGTATDTPWQMIPAGVRLTTTTNQVLIGAAATTTTANLEVVGNTFLLGNATGTNLQASLLDMRSGKTIIGDLVVASTTAGITPATRPMAWFVHNINGRYNPIDDLTGITNFPIALQNNIAATGSSTGMSFTSSISTANVGAAIIHTANGSNSKGNLGFYTKQSATIAVIPVLAMLIDSTGYVGIGTSTPYAKLSVAGTVVGESFVATSTTATSTAFNLRVDTFASTTQLSVSRGFFQDGMTDCVGSTFVQYAIATGKFSCGTPGGAGAVYPFFNLVTYGTNTSATTTAITAPAFFASSTSATSTFDGSLTVWKRIAIGTSTAPAQLTVNGSGWFMTDTGALDVKAGRGVRVFNDEVLGGGSLFAYDYSAGATRNLYIQNPGGQTFFGPGSNLNVNPNINLLVQGDSDARLGVAVGNKGAFMSVGDASTYSGLFSYDYTNAVGLKLALNQFGGNVGIGTTTPDSTLTILPFRAEHPLRVASSTTGFLFSVMNDGAVTHLVPSGTTTKQRVISDPPSIPSIVGSNYMATYSDDITRMVTCGTTVGTNVTIRNGGFATLGANQLYQGTTAQTLTWTSLFNNVVVGRGCLTYEGYHYVLFASTTNATFTAIRRATSSDFVDNSVAANWATSTISGVALTVNDFLVGVANDQIYIATSTTAIGKYTISTSSNTLTYAGTVTLASTNVLINNTRVNDNGIYAGFGAAPFTRKMTLLGVLVPTMNIGVGVPSTTGPDMFVTRESLYGLYGNSTTILSQIAGY